MPTAIDLSERIAKGLISVPINLPAYLRNMTHHSGCQLFEAQKRYTLFMAVLQDRDIRAWRDLTDLRWRLGEPSDNDGQLHPEQALKIAKLARRFHCEGDRRAADRAELALNGAGLLLDEVLPATAEQSIQADQEPRRIQELKEHLARLAPGADLPF